jgi:hypothetical protein
VLGAGLLQVNRIHMSEELRSGFGFSDLLEE